MKKDIRFQLEETDRDKAKVLKKRTGYQISKIYELAMHNGLNYLLKNLPK